MRARVRGKELVDDAMLLKSPGDKFTRQNILRAHLAAENQKASLDTLKAAVGA